jgi:hypothetical protein
LNSERNSLGSSANSFSGGVVLQFTIDRDLFWQAERILGRRISGGEVRNVAVIGRLGAWIAMVPKTATEVLILREQ